MKKVKLAEIVDSLEMTSEEMQIYLHKPTAETRCIRSDAYNDAEEGRD